MKRLNQLAIGGGIVGCVLIGTAGIASAHDAVPSGVATCNSDTGTYSVAYQITLTNVPSSDRGTVSLVSTVPSGLNVTGLPQTHVGNGVVSGITVSGVPGASNSTSLTIHATWPDYTAPNATATVKLAGGCTVPTTTTTVPPTTTTTVPPTTTTTTAPPVVPTTVPPASPPFVTSPPAVFSPAPAAHVAPVSPPLAFTGAPVGAEAVIGGVLLLSGGILVFSARRKRVA